MTSIPSALQTHLDGDVTTLATCAELTRTDGTVIRITDHDADIVIMDDSDGVAGTYLSSIGYTSSSVSTTLDMAVDQLDVYGLLGISGIDDGDLLAGVYDYSEVRFFKLDWQSPGNGIAKINRGTFGMVDLKEGQFVIEFRGMMDPLQAQQGRTVQPACDVKEFGDSRCKVRLTAPAWASSTAYTQRLPKYAETGSIVEPTTPNGYFYYANNDGTSGGSEPTWGTTVGAATTDNDIEWICYRKPVVNGTVTSVTSKQLFADSSISDAADWFTNGKVEWLTGDNEGRSMEVKKHEASGVFTLALPMPDTIQVGDTFDATVGCQKRLTEDCQDKHDNTANNRGFPHLPGRDEVLSFGGT